MPTTPAMQALIEQIYHIFRRYPAPKQFVVCCEYCLSQQEQKALRNTSLRAIPYSLINAWNSSPGPDPQNSDEVRYFLPRLLEFVAQGQFDNIHEVFSLRRINLASKENWREDEREILQQFACQYMTDWVSGDEAVELQYIGIIAKGTRYTTEFKAKAVRLLTESHGSYSSETKAKIGRASCRERV